MSIDQIPDDLFSMYSDMHKDAYGFRPRSYLPKTKEQILEEMDYLEKIIIEQIAEDKARQEKARKKWGKHIDSIAKLCNCTSKRAIEIDMESMGLASQLNYDIDTYVYEWGLAYEFNVHVAELLQKEYVH